MMNPEEEPLIQNQQQNNKKNIAINTIETNSNSDVKMIKEIIKEIIIINEESSQNQIKNMKERVSHTYMGWLLAIVIIIVITLVILFSFGVISIN